MSSNNPTIKDVAKKANVSIATVSRVINNLNNVNSATARRVESAITELNYQRNQIARSLKTNDTKFVGIIAPEISNIFFTKIFEKLEVELSAYGYNIIFCCSENNILEEKNKFKMILDRNVDGIILIPVSDNCEHLSSLITPSVPIVIVDRFASHIECDMVLSNNFRGSYLLTKALIEEGHSKIGFLGGAKNVNNAMQRYLGYKKAMEDNNLSADFVLMDGLTQNDGYEIMKRVCSISDRPNAFVIENDMVHLGATSYLMEQLPYEKRKEIIFASYDYLSYAPLLIFCHYAMAQPLDLIGVNAAKLLVDRMRFDRKCNPRKLILEPRMKVMVSNGGIFRDPINEDAIEPAINKLD